MDVENCSGDIEMDLVGSLEPYCDLGSLTPSIDDVVSQLLFSQMGSSGKSYRRESSSAARRIVSEIYSPPRVTTLIRQLKSRHVMPGYAFDLTTVDTADGLPWEFNDPAKTTPRPDAHPTTEALSPHRLADVHRLLYVATPQPCQE